MNSPMRNVIFLVDGQSFYASAEKATNPAYQNGALAVASDPNLKTSIILAACPVAKRAGIQTGSLLKDAIACCPELIVVPPRMSYYIQVSLQITAILETYSSLVEPYSIDEQFVDLTHSLSLFRCSPAELAIHMQMRILKETGIYTRIGIGHNKVRAKLACDQFAKKIKGGIFELDDEAMKQLWTLPTASLFGIGKRTQRHLRRIGIRTIGQLANTPLPRLKQRMRSYMGKKCDIWSEVLWRTANGIDTSPVTPDTFAQQQAIGRQTTLHVKYESYEQLHTVLLELSMLIGRRARNQQLMGTALLLTVEGGSFKQPSRFARQLKFSEPTNLTGDIFAQSKELLRLHWDGTPVRKLSLSLLNLRSDRVRQLSMFSNREKQYTLETTMDQLIEHLGMDAIFFASSLQNSSRLTALNKKIGGHYK